MTQPRLRPVSHRLVLWFAATALAPTLALGAIGVIVVRQDRDLERQRQQTVREQAVDTGVAALARTLSEFEEALGAVSAAPSAPLGAISGRASFVVFDAGGMVARSGIPLPYYPAVSAPADRFPDAISAADELEFARRDFQGAIKVLLPLVHVEAPAVRAEAWLRLGRVYRNLGDRRRALEAFDQLASLEEVRIQGAPAGLQGRIARALIHADAGRPDDLRREAARLRDDLMAGRWMITPAQHAHAVFQVGEWLGAQTAPSIDADRAALSEAVDRLWGDWQQSSGQARTPRGRRTEWTGQQSVLVLTQATPDRLAAMCVTASVLQAAWSANVALMAPDRRVDFALTDVDGHAVAGRADAPSSVQAVRAASVTKLPWNVHAIGRMTAASSLSTSARLLLAGIALMVAVVVASGYAIHRAVSREMRVAQLQSDFVSAVSHEFRTPLTTIRQLSEMLARGRVSTDERRARFYETMLGESERMHRLVENLLDFGRLEAGRLSYRREPVDVSALLGDVTAEVRQSAAAAGYGIDVERDPEVPPVLGDREALAHVFRNLLDNAVKYSPACRTVWVSLRRHDHGVAVGVRDRGFGIPAEEQRDIFQKFVRGAEATAARIKGTGIGLAMARQIVEAHGGTITVESVPGEGSTFTVNLPGVMS